MDDREDEYERRLSKVMIGRPNRLADRIELCQYDPGWGRRYEREAARICRELGPLVMRLEHVGSTSVPGLVAKPIVDIVLEVPSASDESGYLPDLEAVGYTLRVREPDWFEHRMLKAADGGVNLHVFSAGCDETERMVRFRDRLRADPAERDLYARTKRELAARPWTYVQQYADAKSDVIAAILDRPPLG